jgi:hypothetical protein
MGANVDRLHSAPQSLPTSDLPEHLRLIAEALERLRFGVIQLTVHDGKLMQLDVTERRRFT